MAVIGKMTYYSFDIFDTCISRLCGTQNNLFYLLANSILGVEAEEELKREFILIRERAEVRARNESKFDDITIADIYKFANFENLTLVDKSQILLKELDMEMLSIISISSAKVKIDELKNAGNNIIFISDMYLPKTFLEEILSRHELFTKGDLVFVSGELGKSKSTGSIYKYIRNVLAIKKQDKWIHFGDNYISDVVKAKQNNIKANHVKNGFSHQDNLAIFKGFNIDSIFINVSKSIELSFPNDPKYIFAAGYIAPIYVSFLFLLLNQAKRDGIKHLYFLSRDCLIIFELAKKISQLYPEITFHYLFVSRKSLYFSGLEHLDTKSMLDMFGDINAKDFFYYLELSHLYNSKYQHLSDLTGESLFDFVFNDVHLLNLLKQAWEVQKQLCKEYLTQEGLNNSNNIGIVDIRGSRRCQKAINTILGLNNTPIKAYYLEVTRNSIPIAKKESYWSAITSNHKFDGNIIEQYFSISDQLRTVGYTLLEKIEPVFEEDSMISDYKYQTYQINKIVCENFLESIIQLPVEFNHFSLFNYSIRKFENFCIKPDKHLIQVLLGLKMSDSSEKYIDYVKRDNLIFIRSTSYWKRGSIVLSYGKLGEIFLILIDEFKRILKRK